MSRFALNLVGVSRLVCQKNAARRAAYAQGLTILFLVALAAFGAQDAHSPVILKMQFTPNEVIKYQISDQETLTSKTHRSNFNTSMVQEWKVTKIYPDGSATISVVTSKKRSTFNGKTTPDIFSDADKLPLTVHISPQGQILSFQGLIIQGFFSPKTPASNKMGNTFMSGMNAFLPARPVKPSDTWTQAINFPETTESGTAKNTFIAIENVGHFKTAHIHTTATLPINSAFTLAAPLNATMTGSAKLIADTYFAIKEAKIVRSVVNVNMTVKTMIKGDNSTAQGSGSKMSTDTMSGKTQKVFRMKLLSL